MKKALIIALTLLVVSLTAFGEPFEKKTDNSRVLSGRVADRQDNPIPNAVVYLTNTRTRAVKTYIVGQDRRIPLPVPRAQYRLRGVCAVQRT